MVQSGDNTCTPDVQDSYKMCEDLLEDPNLDFMKNVDNKQLIEVESMRKEKLTKGVLKIN